MITNLLYFVASVILAYLTIGLSASRSSSERVRIPVRSDTAERRRPH